MTAMDHFDLLKNESVLIYGAGILGRKTYEQIRKVFCVRGFIDKRKEFISMDSNIPVYRIDELIDLQDCVVIVCVHNAVWHYEIAEKLYSVGFSKILFIAVNNEFNQNVANDLNRAYNFFLEGEYEKLREIPCYGLLKQDIYSENVIRKNDNYIVLYCRRELLFSNNEIEESIKDKFTKEHIMLNMDRPLPAFIVYLSLMKYFMHSEGSPDLYISLMKNLNNNFDMDETEFLEDQWEIYQLLEQEYEKGLDWFKYSPLTVKWNKKGYFNIVDGHHRAAFYYMKGVKNFPIKMRKEDYACWINEPMVDAVKRVLETNVPQLPILHPYFCNVKYKMHEYEETTVEIFLQYIYKYNKKYSKVLDVSNFDGIFAHNLYRTEKAEEIVILAEDYTYDLQLALANLYYIPSDFVRIQKGSLRDMKEHFQCAVICNKYNLEELKQVLPYLDDLVSEEFLWQSKESLEEKDYIIHNSRFKRYMKLGEKCVDGRIHELGILSKN